MALRLTIRPQDRREHLAHFLERVGEFGAFIGTFLKDGFRRPWEVRELLRQMDEVGTRSFLLTGTTGLAIGAVLAMQSRGTLVQFGAEAMLPNMLALSVIKEIGPVLTSLVLAGRLGAGIGAEIGSMRVTEQIDAIEVMALRPLNYLVTTRVLACVIMFPVLTIWTDALALFGGYIESLLAAGTDWRLFIDTAFTTIRFSDLFVDTMKTSIFGGLVGLVSCFLGFHVRGGTRAVGQAAMQAVVASSVLIILADVIVVRISLLLFGDVAS
ncbi:MAG: ABC transporter permease [Rhodothermales bacterium]|nr:ABC transporter permease [Rhodothermales bacterium]MBO6778020.1 ABC transporter permease [Rhodothermales bacterium]